MLASDDHAESFLELTGGNRRHNEEALIVLTAAWFYADVVSENTEDLPKMAGRIGLTSYRTADLRSLLSTGGDKITTDLALALVVLSAPTRSLASEDGA